MSLLGIKLISLNQQQQKFNLANKKTNSIIVFENEEIINKKKFILYPAGERLIMSPTIHFTAKKQICTGEL